MNRFALIYLLVCLACTSSAQRFYDMKFTGESTKYECLMVYYTPDSCYIRFKFLSQARIRTLAHINYRSVTGTTADGKQYMCLVADTTARVIEGDSMATDRLKATSFLWIQNPDGLSDGPYVLSDSTSFTNRTPVENYQPIKPKLLRAFSYLRNFYYEHEEEYTQLDNILKGYENGYGSNGSNGNNEQNNDVMSLYFIMLANTMDPKIGQSCKSDLAKMKEEYKIISSLLNLNFKDIVISDLNLSRTKLLEKLKLIKPAPNDIVVFSYSGHGSRWADQDDKYPFMDLWVKPPFTLNPKNKKEIESVKQSILKNSMSFSELNKIISGYNAGLKIILGDLCNSSIGVPKPIFEESYSIDNRRVFDELILRDITKLKMLFLDTKGSIISVAADSNQTASGNKTGGYFTSGFIEALRMEVCNPKSAGSWNNIINETIKKASNYRVKAQTNNKNINLPSNPFLRNIALTGIQVQTGLQFVDIKNK